MAWINLYTVVLPLVDDSAVLIDHDVVPIVTVGCACHP
jgi:hypothetical protein